LQSEAIASIFAFTKSANRTVINSTIASTSQLSGGQLYAGQKPRHIPLPVGASVSPPSPQMRWRCCQAQSRLRDGGTKHDGYHRCPKPVLASCQCCWDIAAQGPLCSCAANTLVNTRQMPRFAQAAAKSCGSRLDLPTCLALVPLNAELVACLTSTKREREYSSSLVASRRPGLSEELDA
jgi:hypothetical protein